MIEIKDVSFVKPALKAVEAYGTDDPNLPATVYSGFMLGTIEPSTKIEKDDLVALEKALGKKVSEDTWKLKFPLEIKPLSIVLFIPEKEFFYIVPINSDSLKFL